jgi:hypothetical protein
MMRKRRRTNKRIRKREAIERRAMLKPYIAELERKVPKLTVRAAKEMMMVMLLGARGGE